MQVLSKAIRTALAALPGVEVIEQPGDGTLLVKLDGQRYQIRVEHVGHEHQFAPRPHIPFATADGRDDRRA